MSNHKLSVGIVGATGAVGLELIGLLAKRSFPVGTLKLFGSSQSLGKTILFKDQSIIVQTLDAHSFNHLDIVFFCTPSTVSEQWIPYALQAKACVIDKSACFRMDPTVPLVVPEINGHLLDSKPNLIASPNCSATIALTGLGPLHAAFGLERFIICSYQSVSGSGLKGIHDLEQQLQAYVHHQPLSPTFYPHPIACNLIPQIGSFYPSGYTDEEEKLVAESKKVLGLHHLAGSATCVRVPVMRCHSMAIHASFQETITLEKAQSILKKAPGITLIENPHYPTPITTANQTKCMIGRLRLDTSLPNGLAFFIIGDQLWKGAALNAIQIAERLYESSPH